jgi:AraC family transcriptional regulator of adaptative response/methylated-DNA-[protein]-cysteine methyltransferase
MNSDAMTTTPLSVTDARWAAVLRRDATADGRFFFAVRTTGIYCRPSCPSRRAKRENVLLFASCAAAEHAGFRPCRRCTPRRESSDRALAAAITDACRRLAAAAGDGRRLGLAELAQVAGYSQAYFHRAFRASTGLTPRGYAEAARFARLRTALADGGRVIDAIAGAGFSSPSRAYASAKRRLGTTPGAFQEAGRNADIRYALRKSSLGWVGVAATSRGVCAIALGDSTAVVEAELRRQHLAARRVARDPLLAAHLRQVVDFIAHPATRLALPLDVAGTAFAHRVWDALIALPPGTTTSYGELAVTIGAPKAVRAVARACAANPVALAIPCHRAVAKDGGLAGYRWGVARKAALLAREGAEKSRRRSPAAKASPRTAA